MRKLALAVSTAVATLSAGLILPNPAEATPFQGSAAARAAIDVISPIERSACGLYPWWYPRSWAVFGRGWGCYAYYHPYYYSYRPHDLYRAHPRHRRPYLRSGW